MRITPAIFDAFLKCATKCHLRSLGEIGSGNEYAEWVRDRDESYQREAALRLLETAPDAERVVAPPPPKTSSAPNGGWPWTSGPKHQTARAAVCTSLGRMKKRAGSAARATNTS